MKWYKSLSFALLFLVTLANAQSANRFFYELTFKPKKGIDSLQKTVMILDVTDKKSLYRDYLTVSQDSILKITVEKMQKSGIFQDMSKVIRQPKFSHKIYKSYPTMKVQYIDAVLNGGRPLYLSYSEETKFNWKIENEKKKIGEYEAQKATTEFGGRKWTAWFTESIPFPDGPYKFSGLPGLIVKIEDAEKNYSWELKGNKKIENYNELSYSEQLMAQFGGSLKTTDITREKFEKTLADFKKDPFANMRDQLSQIPADAKMPGTDKSVKDFIAEKERETKELYGSIDNSIEILEKK
ncbi:GLPGLI family protein [Cloacibacterium caeni]|uniref:GLPGLI family protein n=1 Tax=Cloacibacterium caeni TaxID=2004710 RepID=UPI001BCF037C|nr:GLPGLI family protein [Cloacibacterium caeni]